MIYDTASNFWKSRVHAETFQCQICSDTKVVSQKMKRSSLGCGCNGVICVQCFYRDFQTRGKSKAYYVTEGNVSKWDDPHELTDHIITVHEEENIEYDIETYLKEHMYFGKRCPFCNLTCLWNLEKQPQVIRGRLTFFSPDHVIQGVFSE